MVADSSNFFDVEFVKLHASYRPRLLRAAVVRAKGDWGLAEDLVQETFMAAFRNWRSLRLLPSREQSAWLRSVLDRRSIDMFRKMLCRPEASLENEMIVAWATDDPPDRDVISAEGLEILLKVIQSELTSHQHVVLYLRTHPGFGWSHDEISQQLGMPSATVRSHFRTARARLASSASLRGVLSELVLDNHGLDTPKEATDD